MMQEHDEVQQVPDSAGVRSVAGFGEEATNGSAAPVAVRGFTLIELIIAVLIVAILARIAMPYFLGQIRESHRADAKTALLDLASREERYFATNNTYTSSATYLYSSAVSWPLYVPNGDSASSTYSIAAPTSTSTGFSLTATPSTKQSPDPCGSYTLDNFGTQGNSGNTITTGCW